MVLTGFSQVLSFPDVQFCLEAPLYIEFRSFFFQRRNEYAMMGWEKPICAQCRGKLNIILLNPISKLREAFSLESHPNCVLAKWHAETRGLFFFVSVFISKMWSC